VTVITNAFIRAAQNRAKALGLTQHPVVIIEHPIASKNREQIQEMARASVAEVVRGLLVEAASIDGLNVNPRAASGGTGNG